MTPDFLRRLRGLLLLARFDSSGFAHVSGRAAEVLGSVAPLLAFPLVFGAVAMLNSGDVHQLAALLAVVATVLLPLVTSEALARRWGSEAHWGRFAVAFNWSQWGMTVAALLVLALSAAGLPQSVAAVALVATLLYQLCLHWFFARRGMLLSMTRATLLVLAMDAASSALLALFLMVESATKSGAAP